MTHQEFIRVYKSGQITVGVNRSLSLRLMRTPFIPKRYRAAYLFWSWIMMLSFPAGIIVVILVKWWAGVMLIVFGLALFFPIRKSACEFVLEHALEDEEFYKWAVESDVLNIASVN